MPPEATGSGRPPAAAAGAGRAPLEVVGLRTRLRPGMEEAYERAHATVWPELTAAHREAGIRRWLIFRAGLELFHAVECEDFQHATRALAQHPVDRRWQAHMAPYVVVADAGGGAAVEHLRLVYAG